MNCNLIWRTVAGCGTGIAETVVFVDAPDYCELLECALSHVHQNTNKDGLWV